MQQKSSHIRNFWQSHVAEDSCDKRETKRPVPAKPYSFPRWRSTDALSASLVASNNVNIPADSIIPERRLQKMRETERMAQIDKAYILQQIEPSRPLCKGKSLDSSILKVNHQPWYDRKRIRESICKNSIANIAQTRERFESQAFVEPNRGPPSRAAHSFKQHSIDRFTTPHRDSLQSKDPTVQKDATCPDDSENRPEFVWCNGSSDKSKCTSAKGNGHPYSDEEQLFILYMKQNPKIVFDLGITCSSSTMQAMEELHGRRVELRFSEDNSAHLLSARQMQYLKKCPASTTGYLKRCESENEPPRENHAVYQHPSMDNRMGSLIESEIRQLREREYELLESRRVLGLPNLQEIINNWKLGPEAKSFPSTANHDHLYQLPSDELRNPNSNGFGSPSIYDDSW